MDDATRQRDYYRETAGHYDTMHVHPLDEHGIAVAALAGLARHIGARRILDVGAGTGRAVALLQSYLPGVDVVGVEPVDELRHIGHARGIAPEALVAGSGESLPFADDSFDIVIETGVLHHVPDPARVTREMARVAARALLISDCNNYGQGGALTRRIKGLLRAAGLWRAYVWATTGGRMSKWSEDDGVFYSYSSFDALPLIAGKFPRHYIMNTHPLAEFDVRRGAGMVAIFALREPW